MTLEIFKTNPDLEVEFRTKSKNFAATEIALISRFLNGDTSIKETDFSKDCLAIVQKIISIK